MLRRRLAETELAPALAALLEVLRQHDLHQDLFDTMVEALRGYIVGHSRQIAEIVEERSDWWVPRRVDRRVAKAITEGLIDYLDGLSHRDHEARARFDAAIGSLIHYLSHHPAYHARVNAFPAPLPHAPPVNGYVAAPWEGPGGHREDH